MPLKPPYLTIAKEFRKCKVIPFLGAGTSLGPPKTAAGPSAIYAPSAGRLATKLAEDAGIDPLPKNLDLAQIASYYAAINGRTRLVQFLHEEFDRDFTIGAIHTFLAEQTTPMLIITTNYDDLIERAFREKGTPFHLVVYPTERPDALSSLLYWDPDGNGPAEIPFSKFSLGLEKITIIYKMHGSVSRKSSQQQDNHFVITEEDYVNFLTRMTVQKAIPSTFRASFMDGGFLFLGYGLKDWNLRVLLRSLRADILEPPANFPRSPDNQMITPPEPDLTSWAVQYKPQPIEERLWIKRQVNVYRMELNDFVSKLREKI